MEELRNLNRIFGFLPAIAMSCFILTGIIGILSFNQIPSYGINPDPGSLNIDWITGIAILPFTASFFSIPASILISIHLKFNQIKFRNSDIVSLAIMLTSLFGFFTLKFGTPDLFLWIMD